MHEMSTGKLWFYTMVCVSANYFTYFELISCLLSESRMMKILRWALMLSSQSLHFGTPRYIIFTISVHLYCNVTKRSAESDFSC